MPWGAQLLILTFIIRLLWIRLFTAILFAGQRQCLNVINKLRQVPIYFHALNFRTRAVGSGGHGCDKNGFYLVSVGIIFDLECGK